MMNLFIHGNYLLSCAESSPLQMTTMLCGDEHIGSIIIQDNILKIQDESSQGKETYKVSLSYVSYLNDFLDRKKRSDENTPNPKARIKKGKASAKILLCTSSHLSNEKKIRIKFPEDLSPIQQYYENISVTLESDQFSFMSIGVPLEYFSPSCALKKAFLDINFYDYADVEVSILVDQDKKGKPKIFLLDTDAMKRVILLLWSKFNMYSNVRNWKDHVSEGYFKCIIKNQDYTIRYKLDSSYLCSDLEAAVKRYDLRLLDDISIPRLNQSDESNNEVLIEDKNSGENSKVKYPTSLLLKYGIGFGLFIIGIYFLYINKYGAYGPHMNTSNLF